MNDYFRQYLFYISLAGFVFLLLLSMMSFFCYEFLKIKKENHINSGISLAMASGVIIILDLYVNINFDFSRFKIYIISINMKN